MKLLINVGQAEVIRTALYTRQDWLEKKLEKPMTEAQEAEHQEIGRLLLWINEAIGRELT